MMSNESKTQTTGCPKKEGLRILNIFDSYCLKEHLGKPSKKKKVWIFSTPPGPPPPKVWKISGNFAVKKGQKQAKSAKKHSSPLEWKKSTLYIFFY